MRFPKWIPLVVLLLGCAGLALASDEQGGGYLGITLTLVHDQDMGRGDNGVYVDQVLEGSPAEAAGLLAEDRILTLDGVAVNDFEELHRVLASAHPNDPVEVGVLRDGVRQSFTVLLGERPKHQVLVEKIHPEGQDFRWAVVVDTKRAFLGIRFEQLGQQLAQYFGVPGGLLVTSVVEGGPAAVAGLQAGDVLTEIERQPVSDPGALHQLLSKAQPGDQLEVRLQRRGLPLTLYVEAGAPQERSMSLDLRELQGIAESATAEGNIELILPDDPDK